MNKEPFDIVDQPTKKSRDRFSGGELVIGLVGAVGTDLDAVVKDLAEFFGLHGYDAHELRVSQSVIPILTDIPDHDSADEFERIAAYMTAGDNARRQTRDNAIMALGIAYVICGERHKEHSDIDNTSIPFKRRVFIVKSLKRPEEVQLLRQIYTEGFYLIGIYADEEKRQKHLMKNDSMSRPKAVTLMERDEDEDKDEGDNYGQLTRDTFHLADFFIHDSNSDARRNSLRRIVEILFGHPYKTPTFDEFAMFMAFVSALRSADLSRQVGAVVARHEEILATGANDCPRAGGGLYWPTTDPVSGEVTDVPEGRDYKRGFDSNADEKDKILDSAITNIRPFLAPGTDEGSVKIALQNSPIRDITEYGRVVHAEMEALLSCARNNIDCRKATLYCTTFPCHNCAKHLIAAGIDRVVYVEPYPKSKAPKFHDDSIMLGFRSDCDTDGKVSFEPFVGVGPRSFINLFSVGIGRGYKMERKETGRSLNWVPENATLRIEMVPYSYLEREMDAFTEIQEYRQSMKG